MYYFEFDSKKVLLHCGDCLDILKNYNENIFDCIFVDPPYLLSNNGFTCHSGQRTSVNKGNWDISKGPEYDFEFHKKWLSECKRVLKPSGTIWISGTYHSIYLCGFLLQLLGFHLLNDICWFKPNAPPNLSCRYFTCSHETLIWAKKDKKSKHYFNYKTMKENSWHDDLLKKTNAQMRTVWSITSPKKEEKKFGKHPTQKPIALLKRIILASTKEGDLILDPFCGSSTTGIAAHILNRRFVGIDIEKKYLDIGIKRFEESKCQLPLF
ncbi:MAG: site-specific DNA-methyltransferase [Candidatus Melainabacteria bacterium]|nr:site-specific DNA-methyltransferase [Candidatus Melainabacteria bacterium]